jgi:NAD(P)-dependent dehydrogenase (short-subunit alcohol dehydrogenase family)
MTEVEVDYGQLDRQQELQGLAALVTGASSGIGRATSIRFAQAGAKVAALARSKEKLQEACKIANQTAGHTRAMPLICDVTREEQLVSAFEQAITSFGKIDIVVANAGSIQNAPIHKTSLKLWKDMIDVLATAYFLTAREAFRHWINAGVRGSLVFVTSKNAVAPSPGASAYSAAKAAAQHLARTLAEEGGPLGIRTNTVLPDGVIRGTNILPPGQREKSAARHGVTPDRLEEYYQQRNALKVMITPEDVAETILYLASPRSQKLNGTALTVDGGMAVAYLR